MKLRLTLFVGLVLATFNPLVAAALSLEDPQQDDAKAITLDLANVGGIGGKKSRAAMEFISQTFPNLQSLTLTNCGLTTIEGLNLPKLKTLCLAMNDELLTTEAQQRSTIAVLNGLRILEKVTVDINQK